jgi:oligoribonuclease NrnB/cAMP/cGMP phosphodiesterase (DHH superfamily)
MDALFWQLASITAPVCYLEIGKQHKDDFISRLEKLYQIVDCWDITYYRKNPCCLCRGGPTSPDYDFTGLDDDVTPFAAVEYEQPESVADLCTGTGLTMLAAHKNHARFLGTELNRRRLAVAIEKAAAMGVHYEKSE